MLNSVLDKVKKMMQAHSRHRRRVERRQSGC
jgi:hypothetical protein